MTHFSRKPTTHLLEGIDQHQQPIFPSPSTDHARPPTPTTNHTSDLHLSTIHDGPTSPIMARDGTPGLCTDIHVRTEQLGGSPTSPKSDARSGNSNKGNEVRHGSLCSVPMVHNPNTYASRPPALQLSGPSMALPHVPTNSTDEPYNEPTAILSPTSLGPNKCPMISTNQLLQSTLSIFHTKQPLRPSESLQQSTTNTPSLTKRTRCSNKRGVSENFSRNERNQDKIYLVKGHPSLQPQGTVRKKIHTQMPARIRNLQPKLQNDNQSGRWEICNGDNSNASPDSTCPGSGTGSNTCCPSPNPRSS